LPISEPAPMTLPGRRWLYGPIAAPSSIVEPSTTLSQTRQSAPMIEPSIVAPGPIVVPSPTVVSPRMTTPGSSVTSWASTTDQSR
jgi:hypothetical protein